VSARKVIRRITEAFRAEFGKPEKRSNPWPKCGGCFRRVPYVCPTCGLCEGGCCSVCGECGQCAQACTGHKEGQR
jgi:hypothetical protein